MEAITADVKIPLEAMETDQLWISLGLSAGRIRSYLPDGVDPAAVAPYMQANKRPLRSSLLSTTVLAPSQQPKHLLRPNFFLQRYPRCAITQMFFVYNQEV